MLVSPHRNSFVEILPKMMAVVGGVFGRRLHHESGALMNRISTLIKAAP